MDPYLLEAPAAVLRASLVAHMINSLLATQETKVQSLGQEDPLEKEMATHSSTLAWKIPWTEEDLLIHTYTLIISKHLLVYNTTSWQIDGEN